MFRYVYRRNTKRDKMPVKNYQEADAIYNRLAYKSAPEREKEFSHINTHRTRIVGVARHRAYRVAEPHAVFYDQRGRVRSIAEQLLQVQGREEFYLNEFPDQWTPYRFYLDIDMNLSNDAIRALTMILDTMLVDGAEQRVNPRPRWHILRNWSSGKLHVIVSLNACHLPEWAQGMDTKLFFKALRMYIRDELWNDICPEDEQIEGVETLTKEKWNAKFDITALGLRSAYSVKIDTRANEKGFPEDFVMPDKGWYVPYCPDSGKQASMDVSDKEILDTIADNSIYRESYCLLNEEMNGLIQPFYEELKAAEEKRQANAVDRFDPSTGTIEIFGKPMKVDGFLLNALIAALPPKFGKGKSWGLTASKVRNAAGCVSFPSFDPAFMLDRWSKKCSPEEFKLTDNVKKYNGLKCAYDARGEALTWLADNAAKYGRDRLGRLLDPENKDVRPWDLPENAPDEDDAAKLNLAPTMTIYNKDDPTVFADHLKFCSGKPVEMTKIVRLICKTVAFICQGGNSFYITKNRRDGMIVYELCKSFSNVNTMIPYDGINKKGEPEILIASLVDIVRSHHKYIIFSWVDCTPYPPSGLPSNSRESFNMFVGFRASILPTFDESVIESVLAHIHEVLADGDKAVSEYIINWLAHIVQRPAVKTCTALVFISSEGAGKNILTDWLIKCVIGRTHAVNIQSIDTLTGRFNSALENKLLLVCDEVSYGGNHRINDRLKTMVTSKEQIIEHKGIDSFSLPDYGNYIFQSNDAWAVRVEGTDRRHMAVRCSEKRIGDRRYFSALGNHLNQDTADHFATYLFRRDISNFQLGDIPDTDERRRLKGQAVDAPLYFLYCLISEERYAHLVGQKISPVSLQEHYAQWCQSMGIHNLGGFCSRKFATCINLAIHSKASRVEKTVQKLYHIEKDVIITALCKRLQTTPEGLADMLD